jgi:hypothetical protein
MNRPLLGALGVFILTLAIYTLSLAPGVFSWDSAELTLGIYTQGIVHATGYPLYLLLGRAFTLLPLSADFAVRANLFSAVCGALTVALLYSINLRLFQRPFIALSAALLYGLTREIWAQSVVAEVYTLHTALMAGILLVLVSTAWGSKPQANPKPETPEGVGQSRVDLPKSLDVDSTSLEVSNPLVAEGFEPSAGYTKPLYFIALLFGLALANHMAALLVAVVLLPYLLWRTKNWRVRFITLTIIAVTTALLYLYLPIRFAAQPEFNLVGQYFERDLTQPADLLWMVSGRMFGREMLAYPLLGWLGEIIKFGGELWLNYLGVGLLLGIVGIYHLWRTQRTLCLLLGAIFAVQVLFFSSYDVFDKNTMFHTAYLVWAIFIAAGCHFLLKLLSSKRLYLFLAGMVVVLFITNWKTAGRAGDTFVTDQNKSIFAALPPDAMLIGTWTAIRPLEYQQTVYDERTDVILVDLTLVSLGIRERVDPAAIQAYNDAYEANKKRMYPDLTYGLPPHPFTEANNKEVASIVACAPAEVYMIDPGFMLSGMYQFEFVQTGLYRVIGFPQSACEN